jgi:hypothetical protein
VFLYQSHDAAGCLTNAQKRALFVLGFLKETLQYWDSVNGLLIRLQDSPTLRE